MQGIVGQLAPDDIFSVVLFSDDACAPKRMGPLRCADVDTLFKQESVCVCVVAGGGGGGGGGLPSAWQCVVVHGESPSDASLQACRPAPLPLLWLAAGAGRE